MLDRSLIAHTLKTTLDTPLQQLSEKVVAGYIREQQAIGIRNAAVLLVDHRDMSVRAMIGSADFTSRDIQGQVNGTTAKRSPGSALKPFIYALAIDQGLIHPMTVLKDAPTNFGGFSPENFDGRFVGPLTATDALTRSRNVPAVALAASLSQPSFYQFLRSSGISQLKSESHYGLALALGGGEVTMEEAATLYAMLANKGRLRNLRYSSDDPVSEETRLLSPEASFMTLDMLANAPRPDGNRWSQNSTLPVAWKTGTSWGFRDAWTIGIVGPYVLAVWVGNFDGSSNPAFVGVQAAAPLFFRLVDAMTARDHALRDTFNAPPNQLRRVEVCTASGDLPNADCPQTTQTWFIPGVSPIKLSQIHRRIWIDTRTNKQACPPYDPRFTRSEVFEFWSSDLQQLFTQAGMPRRHPPESANCIHGDHYSGTAPQITSPTSQVTYTLNAHQQDRDFVPFTANVDSGVKRTHWFVDSAYVGTSSSGTSIEWHPLQSGKYIVRAVDDQGRADSRELNVAIEP
jgi:penicillin-binding protein 1C